ncbi:AAEL013721-PA [Aedes aegypti]|uniref:AAEL013721-PA n=1 Tax=Aedes aegypti TaxID=7159 RepID=Q16IC6_AEDAE|nr:AAEL013721-PA [Aedes aegypti]
MGRTNSPSNECCENGDNALLNGYVSASPGESNPRPVPTNDALPIEEAFKIALTGKSNTKKMPVSLLYELLSRRGITPQYDLLPREGAAHEQTFSYRVSYPDGDAIGTGQSKKEAKHAAAKALIDKMGINDSANKPVGKKTPITVLQEVLTRRGIYPQYDFIQPDAAVHDGTFRYRVSYQDKEAMGTGKSKKEAKQAAAKSLIDKLAGVAFWDTHSQGLNSREETKQDEDAEPSASSPEVSLLSRSHDGVPEGFTDKAKGKRNQHTQVDMFVSRKKQKAGNQRELTNATI